VDEEKRRPTLAHLEGKIAVDQGRHLIPQYGGAQGIWTDILGCQHEEGKETSMWDSVLFSPTGISTEREQTLMQGDCVSVDMRGSSISIPTPVIKGTLRPFWLSNRQGSFRSDNNATTLESVLPSILDPILGTKPYFLPYLDILNDVPLRHR